MTSEVIEIRDPSPSQPPEKKRRAAFGLSYLIDESPPWYICLFLGFQHYLTMLGGTLAIPFILSGPLCFANNTLAISQVLSTIFFVSGLVTLLQSTIGVRLPIVQGGAFSFIVPTFAIMSLPQWACPKLPEVNGNSTESSPINNDDIWKPRMREIQGAIMVSSLFQILVGFTGLIGFLLRFIGPLTIAPTITLVGVALFKVGADHAGNHWGISMATIALIALFSQYLSNVKIPVPGHNKKRGGCYIGHYPLFRLFPVILAIAVSWMICAIITVAGGFPSDPNNPQYMARTDARIAVLNEAKWFRFPYPGQWGIPTVSAAGVFGMLAGVLASIIESVGDYYACARLSGAPPPPRHAINRGIGMEGIGCLLAGAFGSGNGTTSYSENIGAIGITKVGSLRVIQWGAVLLMVVGVVGKFGALFVSIPDPIVGGVLMVMFGMIAAVGISNLQFADMNSSRNLFIVGFSVVFGLALPYYMKNHLNAIDTGVSEIDQILTVLLSTSMAVGCITALTLDNTIPGTIEERGLKTWRQHLSDESDEQYQTASIEIYDLPFCLKRLSNCKVAKYLPFLPYKAEEHETAPTVGSLRVIQFGGLVMMVVGVMGKFGALFVSIPDPIVGGVFMVMFGMIAAVGISNLQFADMNSSRNLFIVGFSIVFGLALPQYMKNHPNPISTGVTEIDQILTVLLSTSMAVGCIAALILDNTIPGTIEERGLKAWRQHLSDESDEQYQTASIEIYDLPFCLKRLSNLRVAKYLPFLPYNDYQASHDVEMNDALDTPAI